MTETSFYEPARMSIPPKPSFSLKPLRTPTWLKSLLSIKGLPLYSSSLFRHETLIATRGGSRNAPRQNTGGALCLACLEVVGARKNGRPRGRQACLPLGRPFFLEPTTFKRLLRKIRQCDDMRNGCDKNCFISSTGEFFV